MADTHQSSVGLLADPVYVGRRMWSFQIDSNWALGWHQWSNYTARSRWKRLHYGSILPQTTSLVWWKFTYFTVLCRNNAKLICMTMLFSDYDFRGNNVRPPLQTRVSEIVARCSWFSSENVKLFSPLVNYVKYYYSRTWVHTSLCSRCCAYCCFCVVFLSFLTKRRQRNTILWRVIYREYWSRDIRGISTGMQIITRELKEIAEHHRRRLMERWRVFLSCTETRGREPKWHNTRCITV